MMQFYLMAFAFYLGATCMWVYWMRVLKDEVITIHYFFCSIFILTCIECTSHFIEFDIFNNTGKRSLAFSTFNVGLTAARNTLARLIALLISLGYGIVMNKLTLYGSKIGLISFLFFWAYAFHMAS